MLCLSFGVCVPFCVVVGDRGGGRYAAPFVVSSSRRASASAFSSSSLVIPRRARIRALSLSGISVVSHAAPYLYGFPS